MMTEQAAPYQAGDRPGLELLAERMARDPRSMAWVLAEYRRQEGMSHARLCERLGISQEGYLRLALCLRPEPARFSEHLRQITDYTGIDGLALANLIRQVDALGSLDPRGIHDVQPGRRGSTQPAWQQRQAPLSAARDRLHESQAGYEESAARAASAPVPAPKAEPAAGDTLTAAAAPPPAQESASNVPPERGESPDDRPTDPPRDALA